MSQQEEFLKEVKSDIPVLNDDQFADLLDKPKKKEEPQAEKPISEEDEDKPKARRYRRMEQRMKEIEDMNIALNERVKVLSEAEKYAQENAGEVDPDLIKVFGTTEDGKQLTSIFQKKFKEVQENAEKSALERIRQEEISAKEEMARESKTIDNAFENIEDKFGVDLSGSNKTSRALRDGFIDFIEAISPKDETGEIIEYADFETSFETYKQLAERNKPREVSERQRELADRSMTHSGSPVRESPKGPITFKTVGRFLDNLRNQ
jgi:hypothetical protein